MCGTMFLWLITAKSTMLIYPTYRIVCILVVPLVRHDASEGSMLRVSHELSRMWRLRGSIPG
jgi:hypothetical protein